MYDWSRDFPSTRDGFIELEDLVQRSRTAVLQAQENGSKLTKPIHRKWARKDLNLRPSDYELAQMFFT
jgi:hypothetical protein